MLIDGELNNLFSVKHTDEFCRLQDHCLEYNWDSDPLLKDLTKSSSTTFSVFDEFDGSLVDLAFKNSRVIQYHTSDLIKCIKNHDNWIYTDKTKLLIDDVCNLVNLRIFPEFADHYLLKWHVVSLVPNGSQVKHIDKLPYHSYSRRIAMAITSPIGAKSYIGNGVYRLEEGVIYDFNNLLPHYSENTSNSIRTVLFLDIIPNSFLEIVKKMYKC